ncbi:phosphonate C-P lyase system protein PhnG [Lyngbya sp. CCY1209]|uniref:phosphonate C-P lyase system protein PhnG n=1 Tax=Lyngbya sp. CCY1209 TaxID=2886103 RepID=UPI002D212DFC|nr:phosphonate C-P lyase system protein PhnG [Lyngbya sp. CCY1209]MEB3882357.1 phosphonate C-P lyase system protein PhnG [Lyngbya sp. CCY1209]
MSNPQQRQSWMATLAKSSLKALEDRIADLQPLPPYDFLRPPEIGLTMVRGRAGGTGEIFNLGEMTVTRCAVQLGDPAAIVGFGYVAGRSRRHAELAALCDALLQHPQWRDRIQQSVIEPLQGELRQQHAARARQTAATQVNFYTLVRGESE